jgi:prepilin-type N-terminal cleavage/methylation domain-containing protein
MVTFKSKRAFTLIEIMVVVAILAILAALGSFSFIRARQQAQGRAILQAARVIDHAIDRWAVDRGIAAGTVVNSASVSLYMKDGPLKSKVAALKNSGGNIKEVLTVNTITIGNVGSTQVRIHTSAKNNLTLYKDWGGY